MEQHKLSTLYVRASLVDILRIEHRETRVGPFAGHADVSISSIGTPTPRDEWDDYPENQERYPGCDRVFINPKDYNLIFGFNSLDQLFEWFCYYEEFHMFRKKNFVLRQYRVKPDACEGQHYFKCVRQVMFNRDWVELVDELEF